MTSPRRVLLCKVNGLGDLVAFLPTVSGIVSLLKGSEVTALVPEQMLELVRAVAPDVRVIGVDPSILHSPARHLPRFLNLVRRVRQGRFDVALSSHDERSGVVALQYLAGIPERFGFSRSCRLARAYNRQVDSAFQTSMLENDFQLVRALAKRIGASAPTLALPRPRFGALAVPVSARPQSPTILLHPGAKYAHKRWPWPYFRELILRVHAVRPDTGFEVLTDGLELDLSGLPATPVAGISTLELCSRLASCDVVVANNSGPMNLAWLLGVPLVVLSGPSPRYWSPPQSETTVELRDRAACAPCEGPGHTPGRCLNDADPVACMRGISVKEVADTLLQVLERTGHRHRDSRLARLGLAPHAEHAP